MADDDLNGGWEDVYEAVDVSTSISYEPAQDEPPDYSDQLPETETVGDGFRVRPDWMGPGTYASEHDEFAPYW
ncbi:MAG: hypothetical protein MUP66_02525 [Candidatus Nanohaloarchaeota archaeon QJJ-5]|nr:hypothetical protein [Candidatus Nanohaloarchaeota archaeon QJJ-5]